MVHQASISALKLRSRSLPQNTCAAPSSIRPLWIDVERNNQSLDTAGHSLPLTAEAFSHLASKEVEAGAGKPPAEAKQTEAKPSKCFS